MRHFNWYYEIILVKLPLYYISYFYYILQHFIVFITEQERQCICLPPCLLPVFNPSLTVGQLRFLRYGYCEQCHSDQEVQLPLDSYDYSSLGSRYGMAKHKAVLVQRYVAFHTVFHSSCTILHSNQYAQVPQSCQLLLSSII